MHVQVYAQGMSVAAMSACALRKALSAALPAAGPTGAGAHEARRAAVRGMGPAWQRQLATVIEPAWMLATSEDMRWVPGASMLQGPWLPACMCTCRSDTCQS